MTYRELELKVNALLSREKLLPAAKLIAQYYDFKLPRKWEGEKLFWHVWHSEQLAWPIYYKTYLERIITIFLTKPVKEHRGRYKKITPVKTAKSFLTLPFYEQLKIHSDECKNCGWKTTHMMIPLDYFHRYAQQEVDEAYTTSNSNTKEVHNEQN